MLVKTLGSSLTGLLALANVVDAKSTLNLDGIYALAARRLPLHAYAFSFSTYSDEGDAFEISNVLGGIHVACTTVSACARGLYTYVPPLSPSTCYSERRAGTSRSTEERTSGGRVPGFRIYCQ